MAKASSPVVAAQIGAQYLSNGSTSDAGFTLSAGQQRYDANGNVIASAPASASSSANKPTEAQLSRTATSDMMSQLSSRVGSDGFISPQDYKTAKSAWVAEGLAPKDFDANFSYLANPDDPGTLKAYGLPVVKSTSSQTM